MSTLADEFNAQREIAFAQQRTLAQSRDDDYDRQHAAMLRSREDLLSAMRPAQKWEYEAWLTGYLKQGGKVTHFYNHAHPLKAFYVASTNFTMTPLYGALAVNIVVPKGVHLLGGDTGHCNVYITTFFDEGGDAFVYQGFHDSSPHFNPHFVPAYSDTEVLA